MNGGIMDVTTLPLLIGGEVFVHRRLRLVMLEFLERRLIPAEARPRFDRAVSGALRLHDSPVVNLALLVPAFALGHRVWTSAKAAGSGTSAATGSFTTSS
jgi:hypothetical protein